MKILITGSTGFIGSKLMRHLLPRYEIYALARKQLAGDALSGIHWIKHDLTKPLKNSDLPRRVDTIIHLAQSKLYKLFPEGAKDVFRVNINSTFELLEYAREAGVSHFIFASSGGVYGYSYERLTEADPVNLLNFYLSSKHTAELLLGNYKQFFSAVVFRFFFVYGPEQTSMLIPNLLANVLNGKTITIEGNPGLRINPIYVEDAIRIFEPALHLQTSELFNVAGDETVTITDLIRLIEKVSGKTANIKHTEKDPHGDLVGDNTRMKELLKIYPAVTLFDGLSRMLGR